MRACDAAYDVLIEHKEPSMMYGDEWLLHQVAKKLEWEAQGPATSMRVLRALSRTPGKLIKSLVKMPGDCCARGQAVLCFELPAKESAQILGKH